MFRSVVVLVFALSSYAVFAQKTNLPTPSENKTITLLGQISDSGGAQLNNSVKVKLNCDGQTRAEAFSDSTGSFAINITEFGSEESAQTFQASDAPSLTSKAEPLHLSGCELVAEADQYVSENLHLSSYQQEEGVIDVGKLF